jgi:hypothetical protein
MASFVSSKRSGDAGLQGRSKKHKISVYEHPPTGEISMEEFEQYALDRMRVRECATHCLSKERERTGFLKKRASLYI